MDVVRYMAAAKEAVDNRLDRLLAPESETPATIHRAMRYSVFAGGKRIRPTLVLAAGESVGARRDALLDIGAAVEMIHTYSLIHDDLPALDNDDLRRGRPTSHKVFGEAIAILAGDALMTRCYQVLAALPEVPGGDATRLAVIREIAAATGTCDGHDRRPGDRPGVRGQGDRRCDPRVHPRRQDGRAAHGLHPLRRSGRRRPRGRARGAHALRSQHRTGFSDRRRHPRRHGQQRGPGQDGGKGPASEEGDLSITVRPRRLPAQGGGALYRGGREPGPPGGGGGAAAQPRSIHIHPHRLIPPTLLGEGPVPRQRIDLLLVERGLAENRHKAQALVLAGCVLVAEQKVEKPGQRVEAESEIRLLGELRHASRAGAKLEAALERFAIRVDGRVCADLGASTGGFTDCLLQRGAGSVAAYDVGRGQLAWKLRSDPRVTVHDRTNVRYLSGADLPEGVSLVTVDLSFISLTRILRPLRDALSARVTHAVDVVALVKPQFEVGRGMVGKGGVVRDAAKREAALAAVAKHAREVGFSVAGSLPSPVEGAAGNREFLLHLRLDGGI